MNTNITTHIYPQKGGDRDMNVTTPISEGRARSTNNKTFSPESDVSDMQHSPLKVVSRV